jgi:hypothetical protein
MKRSGQVVTVLGGCLSCLVAGKAHAFTQMDLETSYPGASCNAAVFQGHPVLNGLSMENNTGSNEFLLCPVPTDGNRGGGEIDQSVRVQVTGSSTVQCKASNNGTWNLPVCCSLAFDYGNGNTGSFNFDSVSNPGSYWEEYWGYEYISGGVWSGVGLNCLLAPGASVNSYDIVSWLYSDVQD